MSSLQRYQKAIETIISEEISKLGFNYQEFEEACALMINGESVDEKLIDQLISLDDFQRFKDLMLQKNIELETQAMLDMNDEFLHNVPYESSIVSARNYNEEEAMKNAIEVSLIEEKRKKRQEDMEELRVKMALRESEKVECARLRSNERIRNDMMRRREYLKEKDTQEKRVQPSSCPAEASFPEPLEHEMVVDHTEETDREEEKQMKLREEEVEKQEREKEEKEKKERKKKEEEEEGRKREKEESLRRKEEEERNRREREERERVERGEKEKEASKIKKDTVALEDATSDEEEPPATTYTAPLEAVPVVEKIESSAPEEPINASNWDLEERARRIKASRELLIKNKIAKREHVLKQINDFPNSYIPSNHEDQTKSDYNHITKILTKTRETL